MYSLMNNLNFLKLAIKNNQANIVSTLIKYGADVNQLHQTINGTFSALYFAIEHNNFEIVHILLTCGASIDFGKYTGDLLCHKTSDLRILQLLIDYGFKYNLSLGHAIINGRIDVILLVFQTNKLEINEIVSNCCHEYTPLMFCICFRSQSLDMLQCLLKCGADPNYVVDTEFDGYTTAFETAINLTDPIVRKVIIRELLIFGLKIDQHSEYELLVYQIHFEIYIAPLIILVRKGLLNVVCLKFIVQYLPCTNIKLDLYRVFDMIDDVVYPANQDDVDDD